MAPANSIIRPTEATTAAIMTASSSTMPTAVMIESSENTRSMTMICRMTAAKVALTRARACAFLAFERLVDFAGALPDQEQAAGDQDQVAAGDLLADSSVNSGAVRPMIQASINSRPMRMNIAMNRPMRARQLLLLRRQLVHQDGDEDDVVDAQHQLQRGQRGKAIQACGSVSSSSIRSCFSPASCGAAATPLPASGGRPGRRPP